MCLLMVIQLKKNCCYFQLIIYLLDVTCKKKGKFSRTITIGNGDSYFFKTQARKRYGGNVKCSVTYKVRLG